MKQTLLLFFALLFAGAVTAQVDRDAFNRQRQQMQEQYNRQKQQMRNQYDEARKKAEEEYAAFRKKANEEYAEAVRNRRSRSRPVRLHRLQTRSLPLTRCRRPRWFRFLK